VFAFGACLRLGYLRIVVRLLSATRFWHEHQQLPNKRIADGRVELRAGVTCQEDVRSGAC